MVVACARWDAPAAPLALSLTLLHLLLVDLAQDGLELATLLPATPGALERPRSNHLAALRLALAEAPAGADKAELEAVLLVPKQLLVDGVRQERDGRRGQAKVGAERRRERGWSERRREVPLDPVTERVVGELDVELSADARREGRRDQPSTSARRGS
jgi:hypothetical protein